MRLESKVVAITGAAGSLGASLAVAFASEGAAAVFLADIDEAALAKVSSQVEAVGGHAHPLAVDVTEPAAVDSLVGSVVGEYGRIDMFVNTAGILTGFGRIHNLTDDDWRRSIDVNLMGTVNGIRAAVKAMRQQESGGSIVTTASVAGLDGWAYAASYGASKAAVISVTRSAAAEYARDRIRVNCVCPGMFRSKIYAGVPEDALKSMSERHPLGIGDSNDLVGAFLYLGSDEARWTTGAVLVVDGGFSLPSS